LFSHYRLREILERIVQNTPSYARYYLKNLKEEFSRVSSHGLKRGNEPPKLKKIYFDQHYKAKLYHSNKHLFATGKEAKTQN